MNDDPRRPAQPLPEADAYIRRLDPDYIALLRDVSDVKTELHELKTSSYRQERFIVGGWSEDGSRYITGLRESFEDMKRRFGWLTAGIWTGAVLFAGDLVARAFGVHP